MSEWRWRPWTVPLLGGEQEISPDDWLLYDDEGRQVARISLVVGGPNNGKWRWSLQIRPDGERLNGGQGYCDTGKEARELCEARVPGAREGLRRATGGAAI